MRRQDRWLELADRLEVDRVSVVAICALLNIGRAPSWVAKELRISPSQVRLVAASAQPLLRQGRKSSSRKTGEEVCTYCGSSSELTKDHVVPKSRGGSRSSENLVWACRSCNSAKGARTPAEWLGVNWSSAR